MFKMKEIISATNAPAALGPYSHAVAMEGIVFTSGQLGIDPATGKLAEGVAAQAEQALKNLEAVLKAAGASMADVVKTTVFVKDLADFGTVNTIYGQHFGADLFDRHGQLCRGQRGLRQVLRRGLPRPLLRAGCSASRRRFG